MITYDKKIEFNGDSTSAMLAAKNIFMNSGFKIEIINDNELLITGPGMSSTKQNPLCGVTKGWLKITESSVEFFGELGGIEFMKKFIYYFPPMLCVGIMLINILIANFSDNFPLPNIFTPLLTLVPWIFISPLVVKKIQKRTIDAIHTALNNITVGQ